MAENEKASKRARQPSPDTGRVKVLMREKVLVLQPGVEMADVVAAKDEKALIKLCQRRAGSPDLVLNAWLEAGEYEASSKEKAITEHAGVQGTPDAKPGVYKAVPLTNWKGGLVYEKPPEPKVEVSRLAD